MNKLHLYDFYCSAQTVLATAKEAISSDYPSIENIDKAIARLNAVRVLLVSYEAEKANEESEKRAKKAAEAAKAAKQLEEDSASVFGA